MLSIRRCCPLHQPVLTKLSEDLRCWSGLGSWSLSCSTAQLASLASGLAPSPASRMLGALGSPLTCWLLLFCLLCLGLYLQIVPRGRPLPTTSPLHLPKSLPSYRRSCSCAGSCPLSPFPPLHPLGLFPKQLLEHSSKIEIRAFHLSTQSPPVAPHL